MAHTSVSPSLRDDVSSSAEHNKLSISHNHQHHHHSHHRPNLKLVQEDVQLNRDNVGSKSTGDHHVVPTKTTEKKALSVSVSSDLVLQQPPPPDGGWGWFVVFGSFMIHVVTDGLVYSIGIFHDEFLIYFGESKGKTAWIASLLTGMILCSGPLCSVFVNKYGCRAVTIAGAILASISLFASAWAPNVFTLFITVGLGTGFGFGLIYLPAIVSVTCYFEKYRSLATGIAVCGAGVGTFVFSPLNDYLIKNYGWRGAFIILSAMMLNCVVFGALFKPLELEKKPKKAVLQKTPALPSKTTDKLDLCVKYEVPGGTCSACGYAATNYKNGITPDTFIPSIFLAKFTESNANSFGRGRIMSCPNILYPGSLENIRHYSRSVIPEIREEEVRLNSSSKNPTTNGLDPKIENKEKKNWIKKIKNLGFMVDPIFILFILSNFLTSLGFNVPYIYIVSQARSKGIDEGKLNYLLSVMGIANTIGRIILGFISDKPWVNRLFLYNVCLTICGLVTMMSVFCKSFFEFTLYSVIFGASAGAYVGLTSVVLVDLLGLQHLTNAFGLLLLFEGFASFIGPPIAGFFYDQTASYDPGFYAAGLLIAISGLMLFFVPCVRKSLKRKSHEQKRTELINSIS